MDKLNYKYLKDELTLEELSELKKKVNTMSDAEIEQDLYKIWLEGESIPLSIGEEYFDEMKDNIDTIIGKKSNRLSFSVRWVQVAAAIMLPLFIGLTIYFYQQSNIILTQEMIVSTGRGERANITLPDGTIVSLNSDSRLEYLPKYYNKKERKIYFQGEGYFQVHKDRKIPFLVNARGILVEVLGTTFNLFVRDKKDFAELALEEGSVMLLSTVSNKKVILRPHQIAKLNHLTGDILVIDDNCIQDKSAWRRGDMIFRNTELLEVIRAIEENYNVKIQVDCKDCLSDLFTGTLPANNLNEVLEIIERSYHLKSIITGKKIHLKQ